MLLFFKGTIRDSFICTKGWLDMYNNGLNNTDVGFDDEPIDMTAPGRSQTFNRNYQNYEQNLKRQDTPVILKITGVFVVIAMFATIGLLAYFISLGNFNIDKHMELIKFGFLPVYGIFILDSLVMTAYNKCVSLFLMAVILPVFYPIKRSRVTYDKRSLYTLWVVGTFVLVGAVVNNVYPQIHEKILLVKNTADEYTSECDDAVKYLKGVRLDSGKMIIEIVRDKFDDYVWDATKNADGTYEVTVTGDTDIIINGSGLRADEMLKNNTKFIFLVYDNNTKYSVSGFALNGQDQNGYIKAAWEELCKQ